MNSPSLDPIRDQVRLDVLQATGLLDCKCEPGFDRLTRLAARLLQVPVALVSLVDSDRQFFLSSVGLPEPWATRRETPLSHSFCQHVVRRGRPLVVEDARRDPLVSGNGAIKDLGVVAYLGVPLVSPDGHVLGSFCAVDTVPHAWNDEEIETIRELAASVTSEIALKSEKSDLERAKSRLSVQYAIAVALSEMGDFESEIGRILALIGDGLGLDVGEFWVVDEAAGVLRLHESSWSSPAIGGGFAEASRAFTMGSGEGLPGRVWARRDAAWIEDVVADRRFVRHELARRYDLHGAFGFPVAGKAGLLGIMTFLTRRRLGYDGDLLRVLATVGWQIGGFAERRRAEAEVVRLNARLSAVLDAATQVSIIATDVNGVITTFNTGAERILGYRREELVGRATPEVFHLAEEVEARRAELGPPDDSGASPGFEVFVQAARRGAFEERDWTYVRKDGSRRTVTLSVTAVRDGAGEITGFLGIARDVTESRRTERDRQKLAALVEHSSDFIAMARLDGRVFYLNPAGRQLVGLEGPEAEWATTIVDYLSAPTRVLCETEAVPTAIARGQWFGRGTLVHRRTGELIEADINLFLVKHPTTGQPLCLATIIRDERDRARAEARLRMSEARTRGILESSLDSLITIDHAGRVVEFNVSAERTFGYSREEAVGRPLAELIIPPEHREAHNAGMRRFLESGEGAVIGNRLEIEAIRVDGTRFPVELAITVVPLEGRPMFTASLRDITARKRAEQAVRQGQLVLLMAEQIGQFGSWSLDLATGATIWSDGISRILGTQETPLDLDRVREFVHPEDRAAVQRWVLRSLVRADSGSAREARIVRRDGTVRILLLRIAVERDERGRPARAFGATIDITEYRQAEALLRDREARLRSIVETAADAIVVIDDRGRIESFNPAAERLFGYTAAEVLGGGVERLMPSSDRDRHSASIARYLATGQSAILGKGREVTGLRADGSTFPVELSVSAMQIGETTKFTGIMRDVTERLRVEGDLRSSNALLRTIQRIHLGFISDTPASDLFSGVLAAILELCGCKYGFIAEVLYDASGDPYLRNYAISNIGWDDATRELFRANTARGLEFRNLKTLFGHVLTTGQPVISVDPANDPRRGGMPPGHPALRAFLGLPIRSGERLVGMIGLANRPGGFDESMIAYLDPLVSSCANVIEAYRNEHRRTQAESDLQASKEAAESANRAKTEFLANMSHEVRTPAAAVIGYSEMLLDPNLPHAEAVEAIRAIRRNAGHLLTILDDILDLSKIEAGKLVLESIPCSPWQLAIEVDSLLRVRAEERGINLSFRPATSLPATALMDPTRVRQVLVNLVSNALKFTDPGRRVEVRVSGHPTADGTGAELTFEVEDEGIGMTPVQLGRIFRPFEQADSSTTRRFGGTGLGLSITRRLVEAMGGSIDVRSEFGRGSRFTVRLPATLAGNGPGASPGWLPPEDMTAVRVGPDSSDARATRRRLTGRVLLAEDNKDNRRVLLYHLDRLGLDTEVAENGLVALEAASRRPYDLILMDMQMPELDGYGATQSLRRGGYRGPIVALTAHSMPEDRDRCLRAGCDDYLTKPVDLEHLADTLGHYLPTVTEADGGPENPGQRPPEPAAPSPLQSPSGDADGRAAIRSTSIDDPGLRPLILQYVDGLPAQIAAFRESLAAGELALVAEQAHRVRGVGTMYGYPDLTETAKLIEDAVREGQGADLVDELVDELDGFVRRIVAGIGRGG